MAVGYNKVTDGWTERQKVLYVLTLQGYYDGTAVQTLEKITAKKNQKLIITILDEFIEETPKKSNTSARGSLAKYANTALWEEEGTAWEKAAGEKYGNS